MQLSVTNLVYIGLVGLISILINTVVQQKKDSTSSDKSIVSEHAKIIAELSKLITDISEKQTKSFMELSFAIKDLGSIIRSVENQFLASNTNIERTLKEHWIVIEGIRKKLHRNSNHIQSIRSMGEFKNGWVFKSAWEPEAIVESADVFLRDNGAE